MPYFHGQTFSDRSAVRTRVVESGSDDVIGIVESDPLHYKRLHRVPGVRHWFKICDNAFDHLRSIIAYRINSPSIIDGGRDEARRRPENSKAKKDAWKPFLHPSGRLPENPNYHKHGQR